jgi:two-component system chemotaxis response regulator CheY
VERIVPTLENPNPGSEIQFWNEPYNADGKTVLKSWATNKFADCSVLVVDDDPPIVRMVEHLLRDMGVTSIYKAYDGLEALDYFADGVNVVDLVICDWQMPRMDGLAFHNTLRAMHLEIPFVMLTRLKSGDDIILAKKARVSAYITKPFTAAQFQEKVGILLTKLLKKKESQ